MTPQANTTPRERYEQYKRNFVVSPLQEHDGKSLIAFNVGGIKRKGGEVPNANVNCPSLYKVTDPSRRITCAVFKCTDKNLVKRQRDDSFASMDTEIRDPADENKVLGNFRTYYLAVPLIDKTKTGYERFEIDPNKTQMNLLLNPKDIGISLYADREVARMASANLDMRTAEFTKLYCQGVTVTDEAGRESYFGKDITTDFYRSIYEQTLTEYLNQQDEQCQ